MCFLITLEIGVNSLFITLFHERIIKVCNLGEKVLFVKLK